MAGAREGGGLASLPRGAEGGGRREGGERVASHRVVGREGGFRAGKKSGRLHVRHNLKGNVSGLKCCRITSASLVEHPSAAKAPQNAPDRGAQNSCKPKTPVIRASGAVVGLLGRWGRLATTDVVPIALGSCRQASLGSPLCVGRLL